MLLALSFVTELLYGSFYENVIYPPIVSSPLLPVLIQRNNLAVYSDLRR